MNSNTISNNDADFNKIVLWIGLKENDMRAAIFIDGAYLQKQFQGTQFQPDYLKLVDHFLAPLRKNVQIDLLRCYFYHCPPWSSPTPTPDEQKRMQTHQEFSKMVEGIDRWSYRLGKLEKRRDGDKEYFEQKRLDVLLTCDLVKHSAAGHIQHAILVAGDSDFIPAVSSAKESGVTLTLWCGPENTVHKDLMTCSDEVHSFTWKTLPRHQIKSVVDNSVKKQNPQKETRPKSRRVASSKNFNL